MKKLKVGVIGATGYTGEELVRVLVRHSQVELTYDKVSGTLTGAMNLSPVEVKLVNLDLYDFLANFYLFLK